MNRDYQRQDIFAHSVEGHPESEWEPLGDHLLRVAELASFFTSKFDAQTWGVAAGLLHDIGKLSDEFQKRLRGSPSKVDHATAGARFAVERYPGWGRLLAYVIAGHHAGLANWSGDGAASGLSPLEWRLGPACRVPRTDGWEPYCGGLPVTLARFQPTARVALKSTKELNREGPSLALFTRMVFSALIDADRLATEEFYRRKEAAPPRPQGDWPALDALKARLDDQLLALAARGRERATSDGERLVMGERARVLEAARRAAVQAPGLFALTVPTGGGKTLASLAFGLDHAIAHRLDRIIYVIPFTSIIEQTARVFRDVLGPRLAHCVLEHHSAFREEAALKSLEQTAGGESGLQAGERLRFATENWDAPIVVTTAVQFFESLFSNRPGRCRKLHNIARSVVILDEAQMLPLKLLRPTVAVMEELALQYRTSVVLCTATQPAITQAGRDGQGGLAGGLEGVREIVDDPKQLYDRLRRVTVASVRTLTADELTAALVGHERALCIVGTRAQARELFSLLRDRDPATPTFHLSALMCAAHRTHRLAQIRTALAAGACRVVATTVIEAGVDIDFPVVWRQMAGLDSIAQAAGRCNREGRLDPSLALVQPFEVSGWSTIRELRSNEAAARAVFRRCGGDPLGVEAIGAYFEYLYAGQAQGSADGLDAHGIMAMLNEGAPQGAFPLADVALAYRMIDSIMEPVIVPYDQAARAALAALGDSSLPADQIGSVARRLQPYVVNVPKDAFARLRHAGRIEAVNPHRFDEQFMRLGDEAFQNIYSSEFGMNWSDETFRSAEANVF